MERCKVVRKKKIGSIAVDSGQIMLVDPAVASRGFDYQELMNLKREKGWGTREGPKNRSIEFNNGVIVDSGGDGGFDVFEVVYKCPEGKVVKVELELRGWIAERA